MNIVHYQPWSLLRGAQSFEQLINELWADSARSPRAIAKEWVPAADILEEPGQFVLSVDLPGVDPKDVEVTTEKGVLSIRGERKPEERTEEKGYTSMERAHGKFQRRFTLPETADVEQIHAQNRYGVLSITIPKKEGAKVRRIEVLH
jgi:HSP20 family protein